MLGKKEELSFCSLRTSLEQLLQQGEIHIQPQVLEELRNDFLPFLEKPDEQWNQTDKFTIQKLITLKLAFEPELVLPIARVFKGILLYFLTSIPSLFWSSLEPLPSNSLEKIFISFSKLVSIYPQTFSFMIEFFESNPSPFTKFENFNNLVNLQPNEILPLLQAAYNFFIFSPQEFISLWNWGFLFQLIDHSDFQVKWWASQTLSIYLQLNDMSKYQLFQSRLENISQNFNLQWEERAIAENEYKFFQNIEESPLHRINENKFLYLTPSDFTDKYIADVCGICLFKKQNPNSHKYRPIENTLIYTNSVVHQMKQIAISVSQTQPILLEGEIGSGKTAILDELARITNNIDIIRINLGDQTDAKALLGTYTCSDVPGEFSWAPGAITQAVQEGRWIVLEDINLAPKEIISSLIPLLETRKLFIPGRDELIPAHRQFQLFATEKSSFSTNFGPFQNLWTRISIPSPSIQEIEEILRFRFPKFPDSLIQKFIKTFGLLTGTLQKTEAADLNFRNTISFTRFLSLRDLIKWCKRVQIRYGSILEEKVEISILESIFNEAIDCFSGMISNIHSRKAVIEVLGQAWNIPTHRMEYFLQSYKPSIDIGTSEFSVGRIRIQRISKEFNQIEKRKKKFAFTRHALLLMEKIAACIYFSEPVLLVGDTGVGKTSVIQYFADQIGQQLLVLNLSQQTESSDFIGGFKPVDIQKVCLPLKEKFEELFKESFSLKKNHQFLEVVVESFINKNWKKFIAGMKSTIKTLEKRYSNKSEEKSLKTSDTSIKLEWKKFANWVSRFEIQCEKVKNNLAFAFIEGPLVKAVRTGMWVLLDEINLASPETLESLSTLLEGGALLVTERGDIEPIIRHPNFRIFSNMNPIDVGKKDLPPGLRSRFTEFYVDEIEDKEDLVILISAYLDMQGKPSSLINKIVQFFQKVRIEANSTLIDGSGHKPHYSLRSLCRALEYCRLLLDTLGLERAIYEGISAAFLTQLDNSSLIKMNSLIEEYFGKKKHIVGKSPGNNFIKFQGFWIELGDQTPVELKHYIITDSIQTYLLNIARIIVAKKYPILLQGPTSSGKTSMIEYLAKLTGHRFVRINNHEHTDLQEYLGSYTSTTDGKLEFREGILVQALRKGWWVVLDELNLAPSEVLEALNRLLDDNRELYLTETQEIVKPHSNFMLFATQNPPGIYGGRKVLSKAFRNRFLELHIDDIPDNELKTILEKRCSLPESFCSKLILIMKELQRNRQTTQIFAGRHGYITLRDLFRWAERQPSDYKELAETGYMLLAERLRQEEEKSFVQKTIETILKVKIDLNELYKLENEDKVNLLSNHNLVWTNSMKRLFKLVHECLKFKEPLLLVGETGTGKTTICQVFSALSNKNLYIVNCHQHTESSDFLGSMRPVREKIGSTPELQESLFKWYDGPLVQSMKNGDMFLVDEISLAEDAVLERLNSVLEPGRSLLLTEKPEVEQVIAAEDFQIMATMNPGGDFGKRELSPALRNRFTEIWVPSISNLFELIQIIETQFKEPKLKGYGELIINFLEHLKKFKPDTVFSLRDIHSWVQFMNIGASQLNLHPFEAFLHGAYLVLLDGLGMTGNPQDIAIKKNMVTYLKEKLPNDLETHFTFPEENTISFSYFPRFGIHPFYVNVGSFSPTLSSPYSLDAPTTAKNTLRVLRAMQLNKPILLEGSPGVGKTSSIIAIGVASHHKVIRINVSEQTDLIDLLGCDLPVEGGKPGEFCWRDGPLLQAMKNGDWVLLDELNLATQQVLEGLNSILDHRTSVFIPELNKTFQCSGDFRIFACQNPYHQGGGRKGLPKSFLNRFTKVHLESLKEEDLLFIMKSSFPEISDKILEKMVQFNSKVFEETMVLHQYGSNGSPWEFNLRDLFRWCQLIQIHPNSKPVDFVNLLYLQRMRTEIDRKHIQKTYEDIFGELFSIEMNPWYHITPFSLQIGKVILPRNHINGIIPFFQFERKQLRLLHQFLHPLENLMQCVKMNWMSILCGPQHSGKTSLVRLLAQLTGNTLREFAMNSSIDTTELLGRAWNLIQKSGQVVCNSQSSNSSLFSQLQSLHDIWALYTKQAQLPATQHSVFNNEEYQLLLQVLNHLQQFQQNIPSDQFELVNPQILIDRVKHLHQLNKHLPGRFEWVDGLLIHALERGEWILFDNVNFCNPTVLDRLNPLLEPGGVLMVNEKGTINGEVKIIVPHPNFRIFLAMDPKHGEISRPMRNRGVEIALLPMNINSFDIVSLLAQEGIPEFLCRFMIQFHITISSEFKDTHFTVRHLINWGKITLELLNRGGSTLQAFIHGALQSYGIHSKITFWIQAYNFSSIKEIITSSFSKEIGSTFNYENYFVNSVQQTLCRQGSLLRKLDQIEQNAEMWLQLENQQHQAIQILNSNFQKIIAFSPTMLTHFFNQSKLSLPIPTDILQRRDIRKILISMKYFLEVASFEDWKERIIWLKNLKNVTLSQMGTSFFNSFFGSALVKHLQELFFKFPSYFGKNLLSLQPYNLNQNEYLFFQLASKDLETYNFTLYQSNLLLNCLWHEMGMKMNMKAISNSIPIEMNEFIQKLFSLFNPLLCFWLGNSTLPFETLSKISKLMEIRDQLWNLICSELTDPQQCTIILDIFYKNYIILRDSFPKNLKQNLQEFETILLDLEAWKKQKQLLSGTNLLWKIGTLLTFSHLEYFQLYEEFKKIGTKLNLEDLSYLLDSSNLVSNIDLKFRETLTQAACTLRWINSQVIDSNDSTKTSQLATLLSYLNTIPKAFQAKIDSLEQSTVKYPILYDIKNTSTSQIQHSEIGLIPLYENNHLVQEYLIIDHIFQLSLSLENHRDRIPSPLCLRINELFSSILKLGIRSPMDLVCYQEIIWKNSQQTENQNHSNHPNYLSIFQPGNVSLLLTLQELQLIWHWRLWKNPSNNITKFHLTENINPFSNENSSIKPYQGPSHLYQHLQTTSSYFLITLWDGVPLGLFQDKIVQLKEISKHFNHSNLHQISNDWSVLIANIRQTIISLQSKKSDKENFKMVNDIFSKLHQFQSISNKEINNLLKAFSHSDFDKIEGLSSLLLSCIKVIIDKISNRISNEKYQLGLCWVLFGLFKFRLLIPEFPVDPSSKYSAKCTIINQRLQDLKEEISVRKDIEILFRGVSTNSVILELEKECKCMEKKLISLKAKIPVRPSPSKFPELYHELNFLQKNWVNYEKLSSLLKGINEKTSGSSLFFPQESLWQDKVFNFIETLNTNYPHYIDIISPVSLALFQIKYGLRLASFTIRNFSPLIEETFLKLIDFPTNRNLNPLQLCNFLLDTKNLQTINQSLLPYERREYVTTLLRFCMHKIVIHLHYSGQTSIQSSLQVLEAILAIYCKNLEIEQKEKEEKEKEEESIYKKSTQKSFSIPIRDEEDPSIKEKRELEKLFPDYEKDFSDLLQNEEGQAKPVETGTNVAFLSTTQIKLTEIELINMFSRQKEAVECISSNFFLEDYFLYDNLKFLDDKRENLLETFQISRLLFKALLESENMEIEQENKAFSLVMSSIIKDKIGTPATRTVSNIYQEPFIEETTTAIKYVKDLRDRICFVLTRVLNNPEHPILNLLIKIIDRIISLPTSTPLMKVLHGIELLIKKANEWQSYASKEASIQGQLDSLWGIVIRWRRIEIDCWSHLLEECSISFHETAIKDWWSRLYSILIEDSTKNILNEEEYFQELFESIDRFVQSSDFGQFHSRLELLKVFEKQLRIQSILEKESTRKLKIANLLWNIYNYYQQFNSLYEKQLNNLKKPLELKLKDSIKLAQWDHAKINYFRLKDTTDKSHKALLKISKSWKEILQQSVRDILTISDEINSDSFNASSEETPDESLNISQFISSISKTSFRTSNLDLIKQEDLKLSSIFKKIKKFCKHDIFNKTNHSALQSSLESVANFSVQIIERVLHLKNPEIKKLTKQYSLNELLQTLKALGLSSLSVSFPKNQKEPNYFLFLPKLESLKKITISDYPMLQVIWTKLDNYHFKCISRILKLRKLSTSIIKDLTRKEVEKCLAFSEHLFSLIISQREVLNTTISHLSSIAIFQDFFSNFKQIENTQPFYFVSKTYIEVKLKDQLDLISQLGGLLDDFHILSQCQSKSTINTIGEAITQFKILVTSWKSKLNETFFKCTFLMIGTSDIISALKENFQEILENSLKLKELMKEELSYIFIEKWNSFIENLKTQEKSFLQSLQSSRNNNSHLDKFSSEFIQQIQQFIKQIQISIQNLRNEFIQVFKKESTETEEEATYNILNGNILDLVNFFQNIYKYLNVEKCLNYLKLIMHSISNQIDQLECNFLFLSDHLTSLLLSYFNDLYPILQQYQICVKYFFVHSSKLEKSLYKMLYVLLNTFSLLFTQGYCKPEEQGEIVDDNKELEGTGIGEGEGKKDVSDQLENEEQALGLKGEEENKETLEEFNKDEGMEMKEDFEGELYDIQQDEKAKENEKEDEEENLERQMDKVNSEQENIVDEQLWESDEDKDVSTDEEKEDEKFEKDAPIKGKDSPELAPKQNPDEDTTKEKQDLPNQDNNLKEETLSEEETGEEETGEEDDAPHKPEELEDSHHKPIENEEEFKLSDMEMEDEEKEEESNFQDPLDNEEKEEDTNEEDSEQEMGIEDNSNSEEEGTKGDEDKIPEEIHNNEEEGEEPNQSNETIPLPEDYTETEKQGQDLNIEEMTGISSNYDQQEAQMKQDQNTVGAFEQGVSAKNPKNETRFQEMNHPHPEQPQQIENQPNPYRSFGDALKEWKKKVELLHLDQSQQLPSNIENQQQSTEDQSLFRYTKEEEEKKESDTQALGPAPESQPNLEQNPTAMETENEENGEIETIELEQKNADEENQIQNSENAPQLQVLSQDEKFHQKKTENIKDKPEKENLEPNTLEFESSLNITEKESRISNGNALSKNEEEMNLIPPEQQEEAIKKARHELEDLMKQNTQLNSNANHIPYLKASSEEMWRKFEYLTNHLSQELCEQLRLILEPTLAAKLKGDFKSGKRLNMKKVIPYIASDFKKDSIWLKRTKPSKREYQVMVCIDDSFSMQSNNAGLMACEAFVVIANALSRLEVGQIAITSFGEQVQLLHPFEKPFSSQCGSEVLSQFTFNHHKENKVFLQEIINIMDAAKTSPSSSQCEIKQLVLIISDGHYLTDFKKWTREAQEKNIFVVSINFDSNPNNSILEMENVDFVEGKVKVTRYIDQFPFNYYVVLPDTQSLPRVLADALRQWIERISATSN